MKTIWKFPLMLVDSQYLDMPPGAKILSLQVQGDRACLWALVDDSAAGVLRHTINTYGTGHPLPDDPGTFLGTYQSAAGGFIWHVFKAAL